MKVGDWVRVADGEGRARFATVEQVDRSQAWLKLGAEAPAGEPSAVVELWVAPPKAERAAWLVEKATELGVSRIQWISTERSVRHFTASVLERQRRVARSAVEQSDRSRVPAVEAVLPWMEALSSDFSVLYLDCEPIPPPPAVAAKAQSGCHRPVRLLVGPEGGWSDGERSELRRQSQVWKLVDRPLRTETAAVAALARLFCQGGPSSGSSSPRVD